MEEGRKEGRKTQKELWHYYHNVTKTFITTQRDFVSTDAKSVPFCPSQVPGNYNIFSPSVD